MLTIVSASNMTINGASQTTIYFSKAVDSYNITLKNTGANNLTLGFPGSFQIGELVYAVSPKDTTILNGSSTNVNLQLTNKPSDWRNFKLGNLYSSSVLFQDTNALDNNITLDVGFINDFCDVGTNGNSLRIESVDDERLDNDVKWEWHPLDTIKIKVYGVENGFEDTENIRVEYALYKNGVNVLDDIDTYSTFSIKSEDEKNFVFEFQVPADTDNGDYNLFVKAYLRGNEDSGCTSTIGATTPYYQEVTIEGGEGVVFDKNELDNVETTCGETVNIDLTAYNIGTNDEESVLVNLYNNQLGIDLYKVITNLDQGDSDITSFTFDIPKNISEKTYNFNLETFYNYNGDSDCKETDIYCYDDSSSDLDQSFTIPVTVKGNCIGSILNEDVSISYDVLTAEEELKAGSEVQIKATYTNTGNQTTFYVAGLSGYEDWSSVIDMTPSSFTLVKGESRDVLITLKLDNGISGQQTFNANALYNGDVKEKLISLDVAENTGFSFTNFDFKNNKLLVWIVIINVILVILIIIVAIKVVRS